MFIFKLPLRLWGTFHLAYTVHIKGKWCKYWCNYSFLLHSTYITVISMGQLYKCISYDDITDDQKLATWQINSAKNQASATTQNNAGKLLKCTSQTARRPALRLPCTLLVVFFCKTFDKGAEPSFISRSPTFGSRAHSGATLLQHAQGRNTSSSWSQVRVSFSCMATWANGSCSLQLHNSKQQEKLLEHHKSSQKAEQPVDIRQKTRKQLHC